MGISGLQDSESKCISMGVKRGEVLGEKGEVKDVRMRGK